MPSIKRNNSINPKILFSRMSTDYRSPPLVKDRPLSEEGLHQALEVIKDTFLCRNREELNNLPRHVMAWLDPYFKPSFPTLVRIGSFAVTQFMHLDWGTYPQEIAVFVSENLHQKSVIEILLEQNIEIQQEKIHTYGIEKFLKDTKSIKIDDRDNEIEGTYELLVRGVYGTALVTFCPSTGRKYFLHLRENARTCEEAQRILWGGAKFNIIGRT